MLLQSWLGTLLGRSNSPRRRGLPSQGTRRLRVESLEARTVLATLVVGGDDGFEDIQAAINAASPGDEIEVYAGEYNPFAINLDDLIIREATEDSDPVINASDASYGIELLANNVTLVGLIVENAAAHGIVVAGDNNTLIGNTARNNVEAGIYLSSSSGNRLEGNVAEGNHDGIFLNESNENVLVGNFASENIFDGIQLEASSNNTLTGNEANSNINGDGIFLNSQSNFNRLEGNTANDNAGDGFFVQASMANRLTGNRADGNQDGFQLTAAAFNYLDYNTATNNGGNGFQLIVSAMNSLAYNTSNYNGGWGYYVDTFSTFFGNVFVGNKAEGNELGTTNLLWGVA